jgi:acetyl-CoA acetyltransferase
MSDEIYIIGMAESDRLGVVPDVSELELAADAARRAISDARLTPDQIDGVASIHRPATIAHYLGLSPAYLDGTMVGGSSYMQHVMHAASAIRDGYCQAVLVVHGESGRSGVGAVREGGAPASLTAQFETPYGVWGPPALFPMGLVRYMRDYGLSEEDLASVAVAQRKWAALNPRAYRRTPISVGDVLAGPVIAWPLHRDEVCLVTDGGAAAVIASRQVAESSGAIEKAVRLLGGGCASESLLISTREDIVHATGFTRSSQAAFGRAGVTTDDVDHVMVYDPFAHAPILGLEAMGFVKYGEAGPFISEGNTSPGGRLPVNTNGGGLSYTHTGRYGLFAIAESVRQLRGEAAAQVRGAGISVVLGIGGEEAVSGTLVLGSPGS